ncbi:MAG: SAM-dependent methyltransferase [Deltaproteobacteria bacterium]|nr:SAM-dependent methyltransferase [Deltaproteobacteria bacterium]
MLLKCSIFFISYAAIGYEIVLMQLLSIIQWHHFAYMIISLALLGYGASGTFIALTKRWLLPRFYLSFVINAVLFGFSVMGCFALAQRTPLNPLEILWDRSQFCYLLELYLLLAIPFFCAANCIGLSFTRFNDQIHRIYRFDLLGAGIGALGIILGLFVFPLSIYTKLLAGLGVSSAILLSLNKELPRYRWFVISLCVCSFPLIFFWPTGQLSSGISEYKGLSLALHVPDAEIISEHSSPLGWLTVVRSPTIPFRYAPGLSLNCFIEPPPQLGIFTDGDAFSPITRYNGDLKPLGYLDYLSSALPYHLLKSPKVLVLGSGGGMDVLMAHYHKARSIDAVELNPQVIDLVGRAYADFAGHLYDSEGINVHLAEARGFVAGSREVYDLIQVSLLDSYNASASGCYALNATYLYTVEAFKEYLDHLKPGGLLTITRWLKIPPRESLKLFATGASALYKFGSNNPGLQLVLIRSWKTTTLLVKNGEFSEQEISAILTFCEKRSFDVAYYPGIRAEEANRYNVLSQPYFYEGASSLLGETRDNFLERYKFYISPATDDRPYFFHFFKWKTIPEIFSLKGKGGLPLLEWAYPVLMMTLLQALVVSLLVVLFPLWIVRRTRSRGPERYKIRVMLYFLFLGFAFLFIEIAFIQKFTLFLCHPLYAVAVVLCAFLVFAGLGSGYSHKWSLRLRGVSRNNNGMAIALVVAGIVIITIIYMVFLPALFNRLLPLPDVLKILISIILIAPLAFGMGMPFPLGLMWVADAIPDFIPWAWGLNGCASVLGAVIATILAIHFGFAAVTGLALLLYVLAVFAMVRSSDLI